MTTALLIASGLFVFGFAMFTVMLGIGATALSRAEISNHELRAAGTRTGNVR